MSATNCCKHKYSLLTLVVVGVIGFIWGRKVGLEDQNWLAPAGE